MWTQESFPEWRNVEIQAVIVLEAGGSGVDEYHMTTEAPSKDCRRFKSNAENSSGSGESLLSHSANCVMPSPEVHHLFHHPIADHSFSPNRQTLAVARDNNVELYKRSGASFTLQDELKGHDKTVTSVDIAPSSGRIVTCSQGAQTLRQATKAGYHEIKASAD